MAECRNCGNAESRSCNIVGGTKKLLIILCVGGDAPGLAMAGGVAAKPCLEVSPQSHVCIHCRDRPMGPFNSCEWWKASMRPFNSCKYLYFSITPYNPFMAVHGSLTCTASCMTTRAPHSILTKVKAK